MKLIEKNKIKIMNYVGSKDSELTKIEGVLMPYINENTIFIDAFGGSGVVGFYFNLKYNIKSIYNDIDIQVYNFYVNGIENTDKLYEDYKKEYDIYMNSNSEEKKAFFDRLAKLHFDDKTGFYRFIFSKLVFRGIYLYNKSHRPQFVRDKKTGEIDYECRLTTPENFKYFFNHIKSRDIEFKNVDYKELINKYKNDVNAIIYLDPPYLTNKMSLRYNDKITMDDILYIHDNLKNAKCKIVFNNDYNGYIRDFLFKDFFKLSYQIRYKCGKLDHKLYYAKYHAIFMN